MLQGSRRMGTGFAFAHQSNFGRAVRWAAHPTHDSNARPETIRLLVNLSSHVKPFCAHAMHPEIQDAAPLKTEVSLHQVIQIAVKKCKGRLP